MDTLILYAVAAVGLAASFLKDREKTKQALKKALPRAEIHRLYAEAERID